MELALIQLIQQFPHQIGDVLFQIITMAGEETVVFLVFLSVYFLWDKTKGEQLAFVVCTSLLVNVTLKELFQFPRPIGEPGIRSLRLETAGGYSFPSGHSQSASVLFFFLAEQFRSKKAYLLALLGALLVGVSRLYLGVHYPKDVIVGILLGFGIVWLCCRCLQVLNRPVYLYLAVALLFLPGFFWQSGRDYWHGYGLLWGLILATSLEHRFVRLQPTNKKSKRFGRWLGALLLTVLFLWGSHFLPAWPLFDFFVYVLLVVLLLFLYPAFLKWLHL